MRITALSAPLGAEVHDLDLRADIDPADAQELRDAFDQFSLLVVRQPGLTAEEQHRFVGIFGPVLDEQEDGTGHSFVSNVLNDAIVKRADRLLFHADFSFTEHPFEGLSLYGIEISPGAPATRFVSLAVGLQRLPRELAARVANMRGVLMADFASNSSGSYEPIRFAGVDVSAPPHLYPRRHHPLVLTHPRTGARLLYVSEYQTLCIEGLSPAESNDLLDELFAHLYASENVYEHEWQEGDLVVWDNIALQHGRLPIEGNVRRTLRRMPISRHSLSEILAGVPQTFSDKVATIRR